jgi:hypothetical protein
MKPRLPLLAVITLGLGAALFGGCNTYHYYDIDTQAMAPVTEIQISTMVFCQLVVSGAASDTIGLAQGTGCPPLGFPDIGTIEYATFADSGQITFTFNGYYMMEVDPNQLCTTASKTLTASDQITQMGTITLTSFNETNCPPHIGTQSQ